MNNDGDGVWGNQRIGKGEIEDACFVLSNKNFLCFKGE